MSIFTKLAQYMVKMSLKTRIIAASVASVALVGTGIGVGVAVANNANNTLGADSSMKQSESGSHDDVSFSESDSLGENSSLDNSVTEVCEHAYLREMSKYATCTEKG